MNLEQYELKAGRNSTTFEFVSEGKNGRVIKEIQFQRMAEPDIYNLAFGEKDPETRGINDMAVTNNGDTEKILATVASAVNNFTEKYPEAWIIAVGSTGARTRLYRMGINKFLDIFLQNFTIKGEVMGQWEDFKKNKNYTAFAARRKI